MAASLPKALYQNDAVSPTNMIIPSKRIRVNRTSPNEWSAKAATSAGVASVD